MGLYIWIALGAAVGVVSRLLTIRYVAIDWLEPILMGIAGAVVGGWVGSRIGGIGSIDDMSWLAMVVAIVGAGVLEALYYFSRRRRAASVRNARIETIDESERKAA